MPKTTISNLIVLYNLYKSNMPYIEKKWKKHISRKKRIRILTNLLKYYGYFEVCREAVTKLADVLNNNQSLDQEAIGKWVREYLQLGQEELFGFYFEYLDYGNDPNRDIFIPALKLYVDRKDFVPIIQFWELHYLLYWRDDELEPKDEEEPNPDHYYYVAPDPNAPSDLEQVIHLLNANFLQT